MKATPQSDPEIIDCMTAIGMPPVTEPIPVPSVELFGEYRARSVPYDPEPMAGVSREDRALSGVPGDPDVPVRIFRPTDRGADLAPGLVWIHGGGYISGSYCA